MDFKDCVIEKKKLSDLKLSDYNPREISDGAFKGLGASIDKFGLLVPIVYNKRSGRIVSGHQRYRRLVEAGERESDVVVVDLDGNEEIALNITLNNPHVRGKFTADVVKLLKLSEAQIGSLFGEIRLDALFKSLNFPENRQGSGSGGGGDGGTQPTAVITCPKCRSKWMMSSGKVLLNAAGGK
jgi:hypothetical protein